MEQFQTEITRCQQIISERRIQIRQIINIQTEKEINSTENFQSATQNNQRLIVDRDERSERQKLIDEIAELEDQLVYLKNKLSFSQNASEMNFTQEICFPCSYSKSGTACHQHQFVINSTSHFESKIEINYGYGNIHY